LFFLLVYRQKIHMKFNGWLSSFLDLPEFTETLTH
jgi:hypothetical protein